ncbi:ABC transporter permease [Pseudomonas corrugata]|uniref:ABC transporter permease n=1 Tax=Pseudomonas corrugata TaxID=47879 RepID=UPI001586A84F|nr:ABC transporter permease subunit [Pseudomonas corrugata]MCI0995184.1 ABC transporter permease subunit [Pseudomonas corrugata]NUT64663.1 ABC transporter permease subunit [Pseudomonas corrugata]
MIISESFRSLLWSGMVLTVELATGALCIAMTIGLFAAMAKESHNRILSATATIYTTVIRGVPDLALMLLIFYSLQMGLNSLTDSMGVGQIDIDPFSAGLIALGLIYGAYFTETFRGALLAVTPGQMEAATAYGLNRWNAWRYVLFPQVTRYALPGLANNWLVMIKATAIVSIVGLADITKRAQDAGRGSGEMLVYLGIAAAFYLTLTSLSGVFIYWLNKRFSIGVREAEL